MPALRAAVAACLLLLPLSGCALMPDYIGPEVTHESHVTQHFGSDPTNYGSETIGLTAIWAKPGGGPFVEVTDGVTVGPRWTNGALCGVGKTLGPRETFTGTVGYLFKVPHG